MYKTLTTIVFLALFASVGSGAEIPEPPLTVAVYDFTGIADASGFASKVTTLITAGLSASTNFVMLERAQLGKALGEQAFGGSGMVNQDAAAKIGQITGVKVLVTGKVVKTSPSHVIIIASIIGTETGRLFSAQVDGQPEKLMELSSSLSSKITQTIINQAEGLTHAVLSHEQRVNRIVQSVQGTNRPTVSITIYLPRGAANGKQLESAPVEIELGAVFMRAGFKIIDDKSDMKPDVEIVGVSASSPGPRRGALYSSNATLEAKVQDRKSGKIIALERCETTATDIGKQAVDRLARANSADDFAEKILPLLANSY